MNKLQKIVCLATGLLSCAAAGAACYGSGSFQTCNDSSGNSYEVKRYGNTTQIQGTNTQTGTSWSQSARSAGNTTFHQGTASNGASWSGTSQNVGGATFHRGIDGQGRSYSKICTAAGCQ
jgi:hypothetical protein